MHRINRLLFATAILSVALSSQSQAVEGSPTRATALSPAILEASKIETQIFALSTTTDVAIWLTYQTSPRTGTKQLKVNFANLGNQYASSRDYVVVFSSANHTLMIFDQETGVLAPYGWGSKTFAIPKDFYDNGSVVEVGLLDSDENPNNDYDFLLLPQASGI